MSSVWVLTPELLLSASVEDVVMRREMTVAVATNDLRGAPLAAALHCDWVAIDERAAITIDTPHAWSAVVGRIGARASRLHLLGRTTMTARDAVGEGLADALVPSGADPIEWLAGWIGGRSPLALDTAAALIRGRGGDVTERVAFAHLFATGEPQEGLAAFLEKRTAKWT